MKPPMRTVTALFFGATLILAQTAGKPTARSMGENSSGAASPAAAGSKAYVIGPLDVLDVRVWGNPNLSGFYEIRPDGFLSMSLIGEIKADGLTIAELTGLLKEKLSSQINEPEVNVQPSRINSKKVYVMGEVNKPGEMTLTANMTVLDALSNTNGFKDFANKKKIYILRGSQKYNFNYNDVSKGRHMDQNIVLQSGDHIFVPD